MIVKGRNPRSSSTNGWPGDSGRTAAPCLLYAVKPFDPVLFGSVSGVLAIVAIVACTLPAWRATRVNPVVALRQE